MNSDREVSGIYEIKNIINGKRYVGSSKHIERRLYEHKTMLLKNEHHSTALQNAWNVHGCDAFSFNVLAVLELNDLVSTEQRLLDQEFAGPDTYNIARSAVSAMLGRKHKPETIALMRESRKGEKNAFFGKTHSPEQLEKYRQMFTGRIGWTRGKKLTEEHKKKMSEAKKGKAPPNKGVFSKTCQRGHEWTVENTYLNKGQRNCKACLRAANDNRKKLMLKE